jgi:hypothetical protein
MSVNEDRSRRNNRIELFEFKSLFLGNRSFIVLHCEVCFFELYKNKGQAFKMCPLVSFYAAPVRKIQDFV